MELPEESLAHHHRRARHYHISVNLALHNVFDQCLLPSIRKHSFPDTGSDSQRCLRDLICVNRHLPLSRNETNPNFPGTGGPGQKEGSAAEDIETTPAALEPAQSY